MQFSVPIVTSAPPSPRRVFDEKIGIGGVVSLLWFRRKLPPYACQFLEMILMLTADHGPAVSGAHNTIVRCP